jgi:HPt (histidine-containing phosphotransfer) domain-containing protein
MVRMDPDKQTSKGTSQIQGQQAWARLTQRYLADLPQQLKGIRQCLNRGDLTELQHQAHRAKGTSATYRLDEIAQQFARLERLAQQDAVHDIAPLLDQLTTLVAETARRCKA